MHASASASTHRAASTACCSKSDLRNHQGIVQPRLYDSAMVTQITLLLQVLPAPPASAHYASSASLSATVAECGGDGAGWRRYGGDEWRCCDHYDDMLPAATACRSFLAVARVRRSHPAPRRALSRQPLHQLESQVQDFSKLPMWHRRRGWLHTLASSYARPIARPPGSADPSFNGQRQRRTGLSRLGH